MRRLSRYSPTSIRVYDDTEDFDLQVRVRRMTREEKLDFGQRLTQTATGESQRALERRPDECAQNDRGRFLISDEAIQQRRLSEMTEEQRTTFRAQVAKEEQEAMAFLRDAITAFLEIEPGQLEYETDEGVRELTTGEDFLRAFGGNEMVLREALAVIRRENTLTHEQKKKLQSLRDSGSGSGTPPREVTGTAPATAAPGAKPKDSAASATAPDGTGTTPSGSPVH